MSENPAQLDACSPFQQAVLRTVISIPPGLVTTYRAIAVCLCKPGAARAVGKALADNPLPLFVPCHRVICSDRSIGGYQGGATMKRTLLAREGVTFDPAGRVTDESIITNLNPLRRKHIGEPPPISQGSRILS